MPGIVHVGHHGQVAGLVVPVFEKGIGGIQAPGRVSEIPGGTRPQDIVVEMARGQKSELLAAQGGLQNRCGGRLAEAQIAASGFSALNVEQLKVATFPGIPLEQGQIIADLVFALDIRRTEGIEKIHGVEDQPIAQAVGLASDTDAAP